MKPIQITTRANLRKQIKDVFNQLPPEQQAKIKQSLKARKNTGAKTAPFLRILKGGKS
jgi:hypothetical protein